MRRARRPRHNPYSAAIPKILEGARGVLGQTPPPPHVEKALSDFQRRMTDVEGSQYEWRAFLHRHGVEGTKRYISDMTKAVDTWGWNNE